MVLPSRPSAPSVPSGLRTRALLADRHGGWRQAQDCRLNATLPLLIPSGRRPPRAQARVRGPCVCGGGVEGGGCACRSARGDLRGRADEAFTEARKIRQRHSTVGICVWELAAPVSQPGLSAGEQRRGDAPDPRDAREDAPRQRLLRDLGCGQRLGGGGDEEGAEVGTTEGAAGPSRDG